MPKVSIIMPVFNGENYIRESIESILAQTMMDWEFIIINEFGSNDVTTAILKEYQNMDKRIILVQNTERLGISASLNIGLDLAKGEYIARMDSDDISMPFRLEKQVVYLEQNPDIDIVGIKPKIFGEADWDWKVETRPDHLKSCLLFFTPFVHPTIMIRATRLHQHMLRYNEEFLFTEDYDFFSRASEFLRYANMDDPSLFQYRIHRKNATAVGGEKGIKLYRSVTRRLLEQCGLDFNENEIDLLCIHSFPKTKDIDRILEHLSELDLFLKRIFLNEIARNKYGIQPLFYALHCRWIRVFEDMQWEINDERFKAAIDRGIFYHADFYASKIESCNSHPKVSILIPTFNSEKYIMDTLYSLLEQTFQDFEILIVNELGSKDRTTEIITLFQDPRIKVIQNTERLGLAQSLNLGIRAAKGEYIARADADDVYPVDRLAKQVDFLDEHPNISVCGAWQRHFGKRNYIHKTVITPEEIKAQTLFICDMCHSTLMIRKKDFIDNDLWYDPNYLSEDFELWSRAVHKLGFYNLPDVLGEYRWDGENITASKMDRLEGEAQKIIARTLKEQLKITIRDEDLILLSGWFNPFQDDNRTDRKKIINKGKKLLDLIEKQNELYSVYDPAALKAVLKRRYEWMTNSNLVQVVKRIKERRISYRVICKKILKRLLMPVYRPFKNKILNRFDELRRHIWDLDGHMWDYKQEIKAYMDASNPSSQYANVSDLVEDLAARIRILDDQLKGQEEVLKQLQQLPQIIDRGIQNVQEGIERSINERLKVLEEKILQTFDGRIWKTEENLLQAFDSRAQKVVEEILQTFDGRIWKTEENLLQAFNIRAQKVEEVILQTFDGRIWKAEENLLQTIDGRIWKFEEGLMKRLLSQEERLEKLVEWGGDENFRKKLTPYKSGEKIKIVFLFQIASFWPSWESFYQKCINDERFEVKMVLLKDIVNERVQTRTAREFLEKKKINYHDSDQFNLDIYRPHIVVYQTPFDNWHRTFKNSSQNIKSQGYRVVYIPYGIEIGDTDKARQDQFNAKVLQNSWRIYTFSEGIIKEYKKYGENASAVRALGHPKFDACFNKNQFPLSLALKKVIGDKKICLWKVHFPDKITVLDKELLFTPSIDEYVRFAEKVGNFQDIFFIFMPHPKFYEMCQWIDGATEKASKLFSLLEGYNNVEIYYEDDYRPPLFNADFIIIDRSAIMVEAGAMGVPIMYMSNANFQEPLTSVVKPLIDSYYQGTTSEDMMGFVNQCGNDIDPKKWQREEAFRKCIPNFDGRCGQRIAEDIIEELESTNIRSHV